MDKSIYKLNEINWKTERLVDLNNLNLKFQKIRHHQHKNTELIGMIIEHICKENDLKFNKKEGEFVDRKN